MSHPTIRDAITKAIRQESRNSNESEYHTLINERSRNRPLPVRIRFHEHLQREDGTVSGLHRAWQRTLKDYPEG